MALIETVGNRILEEAEDPKDLSDFLVVFPGRRPGVYLRHYLGERIAHPYHPPRIFDIDSFMLFAAKIALGPGWTLSSEPESLGILFQVSRNLFSGSSGGRAISFEDFFYWGLDLLSSFDELSSHLITPLQLQGAISPNLHREYLSKEAARIFESLPAIYDGLEKGLLKRGLLTRGLSYKMAGGLLSKPYFPFKRAIFAGFYKVTAAEKAIVEGLKERLEVTEIEDDRVLPAQLVEGKNICFFKGHNIHSQLKLLRHTLEDLPGTGGPSSPFEDTVIVIPRPDSLVPLLEWVVEPLEHPYNVSIGYPATRTPLFSLFLELLKAQEEREGGLYFVQSVQRILEYPYIKGFSQGQGDMDNLLRSIRDWVKQTRKPFAFMDELAASIEEKDLFKALYSKLFRPFEEANSLGDAAQGLLNILKAITERKAWGLYPFSTEAAGAISRALHELLESSISKERCRRACIRRFISHLFQRMRIPFQGLPLKGLQVLGLLETRCLSFKNVLVIDSIEGVLPPEPKISPFLPPWLRRALGLPDIYSSVEITRHHFYQLIKKAENVYLFWTENPKEARSRFIEEIIWELEKRAGRLGAVEVKGVPPLVQIPSRRVFSVKKGRDELERLKWLTFSPSSIDTYLECPYRFYLEYIKGIGQDEANLYAVIDEFDAATIGELIHKVLHRLYSPFLGKELLITDSLKLELEAVSRQCFQEAFGPMEGWSGAVRLLFDVIRFRLGQLLEMEKDCAQGNKILALEIEIHSRIRLFNGNEVGLKGRIDRLEQDEKGRFWVIDYKTGNTPIIPKDYSEKIVESLRSLQVPIYLFLAMEYLKGQLNATPSWTTLNGAIYALKGIKRGGRATDVKKTFFNDPSKIQKTMEGLFLPRLKAVLQEILDPEVEFSSNPVSEESCIYCPYAGLGCR